VLCPYRRGQNQVGFSEYSSFNCMRCRGLRTHENTWTTRGNRNRSGRKKLVFRHFTARGRNARRHGVRKHLFSRAARPVRALLLERAAIGMRTGAQRKNPGRYFTLIVTFCVVLTLPTVSTTGTAPGVRPSGTTALMTITPDSSPTGVPADKTVAV